MDVAAERLSFTERCDDRVYCWLWDNSDKSYSFVARIWKRRLSAQTPNNTFQSHLHASSLHDLLAILYMRLVSIIWPPQRTVFALLLLTLPRMATCNGFARVGGLAKGECRRGKKSKPGQPCSLACFAATYERCVADGVRLVVRPLFVHPRLVHISSVRHVVCVRPLT